MKTIDITLIVDVGPGIAAFRRLAETTAAMGLALRPFIDVLVRRAAIEKYDIAESDIRRVDGHTVVLWNRRRIDITRLLDGER